MSDTSEKQSTTTRGITDSALLDLLEIMQTLRAANGCPWDAEQTPESLTPYIIEEACELVDAIESGDQDQIRDELGDLLLQVVFQAQIFNERGLFNFHDVAATISSKLIRRHPHVFEEDADRDLSTEELNRQWESIKQEERANRTQEAPETRLPKTLPALQRAQKVLTAIPREQVHELLRNTSEHEQTCDQLQGDTHAACQALTEEKLGRALMTLVCHAELSGLNAEQALRRATLKFSGN